MIFESFPSEVLCPLCMTAEDKQCVLVPIHNTTRGKLVQCAPVHLDCLLRSVVMYSVRGLMVAVCHQEWSDKLLAKREEDKTHES
jgi:hypothetical protein